MKKTLSSAYEQILESESKSKLQNPSMDTVGNIKPKQDFFGETPDTVEGAETAKATGAENAKEGPKHKVDAGSSSTPQAPKTSFKGSSPAKDVKVEDAEEVEDEEVSPKEEKEEKEEKQKNENYNIMSAFETLFRKTINEEDEMNPFGNEEVSAEEPSENDLEAAENTEEEAEEALEDTDDLMSDLKSLHDHLATIISKLEDSVEDSEDSEDSEEYTDEDFEQEFSDEEDAELNEESKKMSAVSNETGKKRISIKNNKVGNIAPKSKKANTGNISEEPTPKALKSNNKKLQAVKGKPEPKSTVQKGEFFK